MTLTPFDLSDRMSSYRNALYNFVPDQAQRELDTLTGPTALFRMCTPFETCRSVEELFEKTFRPLVVAIPDLEFRDMIRIAGLSQSGQTWVGIMGNIHGVFSKPFLDIPPTGHVVHMRYHEFYRFSEAQIVEMHAIWDLPELMMQANVWPMAPSLGREWCVPGPALLDGISRGQPDPKHSARSLQVVERMLEQMKDYPAKGGPETMQLERFWHPRMGWYGPAGIGTSRGFDGFTNWHMSPWVNGMPSWSDQEFHDLCHFFGDGAYVGETGWPAMKQTLVGDGFRGIPPTGQNLDIRGLDFWRVEDDLIRENWVMVDLLHMYQQLGVDVLARMRQLRKTSL
ncbi:ester cyclase [uncultured Ruegeria sp.]|uniref:ester cyclase n=1 Tax=uncultured Ruegeria sp. TaxID=259304 RepID=UPI00261A1C8F|nr:ester cyclase [uncultured Ruegeria sp.]